MSDWPDAEVAEKIHGEDENVVSERRERIATAVLAGLASEESCHRPANPCHYVEVAVRWADALIAELDKEGK